MGIFANLTNTSGKKWAMGCGVLVLLCGIGGVVAGLQVVDFPIVANRADAVVKEYRAAGLPWEQSDLRTEFPDDQNGTADFEKAIALAHGKIDTLQKQVSELMAAKKFDEAAVLLRENKGVLDALRRASGYEGFDFDRDWDLGPRILFPEYAMSKSGVKMLSHQALISARAGNLNAALSDLRSAFQLGNTISREPTLIALLVGIANQSISLRGALDVAALRPKDAAWIARVRKEVETWECELDFARAMEGEAYMGLSAMRNFRGNALVAARSLTFEDGADTSDSFTEEIVRTGMPKGMTNTAFAVRLLEAHIYFRKEIDASNGNWTEVSRKMDDYALKLHAPPLKASQLMNRILFPVFVQAGVATDGAYFRPGAARGVLQAAEIRAKTGQYPKDIEKLGFEIIDPATGLNAVYKVSGSTVMIYSVGGNGKDDGGERDKNVGSDDLMIKFPPN